MQVNPSPNPLEWAFQHLSLIGWPAVCYFAWRVGRYFLQIQTQAIEMRDNVHAVVTNHLPHMQSSLASIDETLKRQEIRWEGYLTAKAAKHKED